jgi:hypothetical protein
MNIFHDFSEYKMRQYLGDDVLAETFLPLPRHSRPFTAAASYVYF